MTDDDNVTALPVVFKEPPAETDRSLFFPHEVGKVRCSHFFVDNAKLIIDEKLATVECGHCGERLNPMSALSWLAHRDSQFHRAAKRYQEEQRRLAARSRTKCQHCGQMTRISNR